MVTAQPLDGAAWTLPRKCPTLFIIRPFGVRIVVWTETWCETLDFCRGVCAIEDISDWHPCDPLWCWSWFEWNAFVCPKDRLDWEGCPKELCFLICCPDSFGREDCQRLLDLFSWYGLTRLFGDTCCSKEPCCERCRFKLFISELTECHLESVWWSVCDICFKDSVSWVTFVLLAPGWDPYLIWRFVISV